MDRSGVYIPGLDGLRAVAVLGVLLFHSAPSGPAAGGFIGVDIFFVLSGFLITSILAQDLKERGRVRLQRFYWRRLLRLMPPLLLFLGCYLLVAPLVWPGHDHVRDVMLTAFYVSDYSYTFWQLPLYLQHSWSLAVEEQFYLIWPFLLTLLVRSEKPLPWLIAAYALCVLWRFAFLDNWMDYYYRLDTRFSGLIVGSIAYFLVDRVRVSQRAIWGSASVLVLVVLLGDIRHAALVIPFAEFAAAVIIFGIVAGQAGAVGVLLESRCAVGIGKLSYGIYLWHYPIAYAVRDMLPFAPTAAIVAASSVMLAAASYFTVEAWSRSLKSASAGHRIAASPTPAA